MVGHNPSFEQVVLDLTGGRVDFKKGGVAGIRVSVRRGDLLVLMRPRELESLALSRCRATTTTSAESAAAAVASATSARLASDGASTNSPGLCAFPPRGPSPSTVSGITEARWLASLAPPRRTPVTARPSAALARSSSGTVAASRVHPRPQPHQLGVQRDAADLGGDRLGHALDRGVVVGAQVADELAAAGDDVERVAGVQDGRHGGEPVGAVRRVARGDRLGGGGEREQRVAAAVGRRARVRRAALRVAP